MAKQTFTAAQVLTAAQMNALQSNDFNQTVTTKTASYTPTTAVDAGTRLVMNAAGATTITINTSIYSAGDTLTLLNIGAGVTTLTAGTCTISSAGPLAIPQYGGGTLFFSSASAAVYFPSAGPTASSGLTFITSGTISNTTSVNSCFTATYQNYKLVLENLVSGINEDVLLRLRASGTDNTSSLYSYMNLGQNTNSSTVLNLGVGRDQTSFKLGADNAFANGQSISIDIFSPQLAKNTHYGPGIFWQGQEVSAGLIAGIHKSTTAFDGFTIFPPSSTLAGTFKLYG